jgi:hypothetical protein
MMLDARGHSYPAQQLRVTEFPVAFGEIFHRPAGLAGGTWPPDQVNYLGSYLTTIGCKTLVVEDHYIDRDYVGDVSLFYSRSLRCYPNYCYRLHFFSEPFDEVRFRTLLLDRDAAARASHQDLFQNSYLGFTVVRPLAGAPVGRTVLATFPELKVETGERRVFAGARDYTVHLGGYELRVRGLAFKQQDQGVSACATAALWSALQRVAPLEGLRVPTPADITESASRYVLQGGRALPSAGLNVDQICEAIRAAGLSPLIIPTVSSEFDRAQLLGYTASGFTPVLAIQSLSKDGTLDGNEGHAVCAVGVKLGEPNPTTGPGFPFRDAATGLRGLYLHDDRLGPYATTQIGQWTLRSTGAIRTLLTIGWAGSGDPVESDAAILHAIIVPLPPKVRLTVARMRVLALSLAQAVAKALPEYERKVTMDCRYTRATSYREEAFKYGLSDDGLYRLLSSTTLSRYIGLIQLTVPEGPILDVLLDATETEANPSVLACIRRRLWPEAGLRKLHGMADALGAPCLI